MTLYEQKRTHPDEFRALTGLNPHEFDDLLPFFDDAWLNQMEESTMLQGFRWIRGYSSYKNSPLPTSADTLFFILVYLKTNPIQTVHGALFGMAQPNANKWIHATMPALFHALSAHGCIPATTTAELQDWFRDHPDDPLFFSTTARNARLNDPPPLASKPSFTVATHTIIPLNT